MRIDAKGIMEEEKGDEDVRKQTTAAGLMMMTREDFKNLKLGEKSELSKVGLMKTAVTNVGLVKTSGIHSGGPISWPTQWGVNLLASTTGLVIRLKDAT